MKKIHESEINSRCKNLRKCLIKKGIDFCLILQNVSRYYFSGTMQDAVLLLHAEHDPVLFVKRTLGRAQRESPFELVFGYKNIREVSGYISDHKLKNAVIGLEMDVLPAKMYLGFCSVFPGARFIDISMDTRSIRAVKSEQEISLLIEGGRRLDNVFEKLAGMMEPDMTELDLYRTLNELFVLEGASLITRSRRFNMEVPSSTVLSGVSAGRHSSMDSPSGGGDGICTAYPFGAGLKKLGRREPVLIDVAFNHEGYIVDCTRIYAIGGLDPVFTRAHTVSMEIHEIFRDKIKEQKTVKEICETIYSYVEKEGLIDVFMGGANFIGHGVGLELDELPIINGRFEECLLDGMVIAFEPKFVFNRGSVGYEDTYYINKYKLKTVNKTGRSIQNL